MPKFALAAVLVAALVVSTLVAGSAFAQCAT